VRFVVTSAHATVLRLLRQSQGLGIGDIAGMVNGSSSAISQLESVKLSTSKSMELVEKLCWVFDITITDLEKMASVAKKVGLAQYEKNARSVSVAAIKGMVE
jgi:predicted transcriptional regulator